MAQAKNSDRETEDLMKEVAALRADFGALTRELKALARNETEALSARAADRVVALKASGERKLEEANEIVAGAAEEASGLVKAHPAAAVAISAAVGFLVGALTSRR